MFRTALITIALACPTVAGAFDLKVMTAATEIGSVIGSEKTCGLTFDQAAIRAYIDERIPSNSMEFPNALETSVTATQYKFGQMSQSAKAAYCHQIERVAKSYGFTN